jgi:hypothetical protein
LEIGGTDMKKISVLQCGLIIIAAVIASNILQFYIFNQDSNKHLSSTASQPIYESKYNLYNDYASRIQNVYQFLVQLDNVKTPNDSYLLSEGFYIGISSDYYTYLESLIRKTESANYSEELKHIIETNENLQIMIYELKNYFTIHQNDASFPEQWKEIKSLLKETNVLLASGSSKDTTLYNITSYPENFVPKPDYQSTMSDLNENFANLVNLLR